MANLKSSAFLVNAILLYGRSIILSVAISRSIIPCSSVYWKSCFSMNPQAFDLETVLIKNPIITCKGTKRSFTSRNYMNVYLWQVD